MAGRARLRLAIAYLTEVRILHMNNSSWRKVNKFQHISCTDNHAQIMHIMHNLRTGIAKQRDVLRPKEKKISFLRENQYIFCPKVDT